MFTSIPPRHGESWTALEDYYLRCSVQHHEQKPKLHEQYLRQMAWKHQRNCNAICARISRKFGPRVADKWYGLLREATERPLQWRHDAKPPAFVSPVHSFTAMDFSDHQIDATSFSRRWMPFDILKRDTPDTFWMCMAVGGSHSPKHRHATEAIATEEALRLSKILGMTVYVVKAVGVIEPPPPKPVDYKWTRISS